MPFYHATSAVSALYISVLITYLIQPSFYSVDILKASGLCSSSDVLVGL